MDISGGIVIPKIWLPDVIKNFSARARLMECRQETVLFWVGDESDCVFFIEKGQVRMCHSTTDGNVITLLTHNPGDLVGIGGVFTGGPREVFAITVGPCTVWRIRGDVFFDFLYEYPRLPIAIATELSDRMRRIDQEVLRVSSLDADARLVLALRDLVRQNGEKGADGRVTIRTTHQELAEVMCTCRQTTTEAVGKLKGSGFIETRRGSIVINDMERLNGLAAKITGGR